MSCSDIVARSIYDINESDDLLKIFEELAREFNLDEVMR